LPPLRQDPDEGVPVLFVMDMELISCHSGFLSSCSGSPIENILLFLCPNPPSESVRFVNYIRKFRENKAAPATKVAMLTRVDDLVYVKATT
jgi:hypothetical protein